MCQRPDGPAITLSDLTCPYCGVRSPASTSPESVCRDAPLLAVWAALAGRQGHEAAGLQSLLTEAEEWAPVPLRSLSRD